MLKGSIDLSESQSLKTSFEQLISSELVAVSLDMSEVNYIDSSGVAALLFIKKTTDRLNINLEIGFISNSVFRVLELARLDKLLKIKPESICKNTPSVTKDGQFDLDKVDTSSLFVTDLAGKS